MPGLVLDRSWCPARGLPARTTSATGRSEVDDEGNAAPAVPRRTSRRLRRHCRCSGHHACEDRQQFRIGAGPGRRASTRYRSGGPEGTTGGHGRSPEHIPVRRHQAGSGGLRAEQWCSLFVAQLVSSSASMSARAASGSAVPAVDLVRPCRRPSDSRRSCGVGVRRGNCARERAIHLALPTVSVRRPGRSCPRTPDVGRGESGCQIANRSRFGLARRLRDPRGAWVRRREADARRWRSTFPLDRPRQLVQDHERWPGTM